MAWLLFSSGCCSGGEEPPGYSRALGGFADEEPQAYGRSFARQSCDWSPASGVSVNLWLGALAVPSAGLGLFARASILIPLSLARAVAGSAVGLR